MSDPAASSGAAQKQKAATPGPPPVLLSAQAVRIAHLEVAAYGRRTPTEAEVAERRADRLEQVREWRKQEAAAAKEAGIELDAADEDEDPMAPEDVDRLMLKDMVVPIGRKEMRTRQHVIERQLEPLLRVKKAGQVPQALRQVEENLAGLGVFVPQDLPMQPISVQVLLTEDAAPMRAGNTVQQVSSAALLHPTLLERMLNRVGRTVSSAAAVVGLDGDDDDGEDDGIAIGGLALPAESIARPLKLTLCLPPERRVLTATLGAHTGGSVSTSDVGLDLNVRNGLGFGESVALQLKQGVDADSLLDVENNSINLAATVPELITRRSSATFQIGIDRQHMPDSSLQQVSRGASIVWAPYSGHHRLRYELCSRSLQALSTRLPDEQQTVPAPIPTDQQQQPYRLLTLPSSWWPWKKSSSNAAAAAASASEPAASSASVPASHAPSAAYSALVCPSVRFREPSASILSMVNCAPGFGVSSSLKSALHYSYTLRSRRLDDAADPTQGWSSTMSAEWAGVGGIGDAKFLKLESEGKAFWRLPLPGIPHSWGLSFGLGGLAQYVHNLSERHSRVFVGDRLFLGHSLTLRGLPPNTCGPRDGQDALGGELALATAAHLGAQIRPGVRAHLFWNAGNLIGIHKDVFKAVAASPSSAAAASASPPLPAAAIGASGAGSVSLQSLPRSSLTASSLANAMLATARQSVGVGISCSVGGARFEIHLAHPIAQQPHDRLQNRWPIQFGFGLQWV